MISLSDETPESIPPAYASRCRRLFDHLQQLAMAIGIVVSVATALRALALYWWVADLFCQFAVQYVLLMVPVLIFTLVGRRFKAAALFAIVLVVNGFVLSPYFPGSPPGQRSGDRSNGDRVHYRLLSQNVLVSNRDYRAFIDLINEEQPDFIVLIEIDQQWINALKKIHKNYPYRQTAEQKGSFGIGFYSRWPWSSMETIGTGPDNLPTLFVTIPDAHSTGADIHIRGVHPMPPTGLRQANSRNQQLMEVASREKREGINILTGDFNLTPWSPWFRRLLDEGYHDPFSGTGVHPTWHVFPTMMGGVKIDHALIDQIQKVRDVRIGPDIGSDHRAVILDFDG